MKMPLKKKKEKFSQLPFWRIEGLKQKLVDPSWKPDFGPAEFNDSISKSGATAISAGTS